MPDQTSNWHIATWTVGLTCLPLLSGGAHIEIVAAVTVVMLCTTLVGIRVHRGSLQLPKDQSCWSRLCCFNALQVSGTD